MNFIDPALANDWTAALLRTSVQGGVVILIVGLTLRLLRNPPPALHAWAWRIVLAKLILGMALTAPILLEGPAVLPGQASAHIGESARVTLAQAILGISLIGGAIVAGMLLADFAAARRLRGGSAACARAAVVHEVIRLSEQMRLRFVPEVHESSAIDRPMLLGGGRAIVLLPVSLLEDEQRSTVSPALSAILGHELAHLKRHDLFWGWLAAAVQVVFFFHPLVWLAQNRLRRAQDEACDALALRHAPASPAEYGRALLRLAQGPPGPAFAAPLSAGVIEPFHNLRQRLRKLGTRSSGWRVLPVASLAMVCLAAAPTWRVQREPRTLDLGGFLFVETSDDEPITVPVIIGDGAGSVMVPFVSGRTEPDRPASPAAAKADLGEQVGRRASVPARSLGSARREKARDGVVSPIAAVSTEEPRFAAPVQSTARSKESSP